MYNVVNDSHTIDNTVYFKNFIDKYSIIHMHIP